MKNTGKNKSIDFSWIIFLPIMILLGVIPLIVRLVMVDVDQAVASVMHSNQIADFFSQYKSVGIIVMASLMLVVLFIGFDRKNIELTKTTKLYGIFISIFLAFSLISTVTSEYRQIAMWGIVDRYEGMLVIGAYIIMMIYTIYAIKSEKDMKYIILPLCWLVAIIGILGVSQYIGKDLLLNTSIGKQLIVPDKYAYLRNGLSSSYEAQRIYGTMYHYNYIGSFGAMMVPLFLTLTLFLKGKKNRLLFGGITLISIFLLFGSTSRAGIIGLICSIVVLIIAFGRQLIKHYKWITIVIGIIIVVLFGLNTVTKGAIFSRIPSLVNDAIGLFLPSDENFDYKDHIPVKNIYAQDDAMIVQTQQDELTIRVEDEILIFTDQNDEIVNYELVDDSYITQDPRFNRYIFVMKKASEGAMEDYTLFHVDGWPTLGMKFEEKEAYLVNKTSLERMEIEEARSIGFKGKEKLGSARGYIWSRSLPMLMDNLIIGDGPDTYVLEFPQDDIFGKWYAYDAPDMVVTKPHNLYLQIGIGQGGVALVAFLGLIGLYLIQSMKLYMFKQAYCQGDIIGIAMMLAVIGYLGAGIFNDSIVSVAPIFWILLGAGIAMNNLTDKKNKESI